MKGIEKAEKENKGKTRLLERDKNKMIDEAFVQFSSACVECPGKYTMVVAPLTTYLWCSQNLRWHTSSAASAT